MIDQHRRADEELHTYRAEAIVTSTEQAIDDIRDKADRAAQARADEARAAADAAARRVVRETAALTAQHLMDSKGSIDDFVADQLIRMSRISDQMIERLEVIADRMDKTTALAQEAVELLVSLGAAAEQIAREARRAWPERPGTPPSEAPASTARDPDAKPAPQPEST